MPETETQERLHLTLAALRRFRRNQLSAREPVSSQLSTGFLGIALLAFFLFGFHVFVEYPLHPLFVTAAVMMAIGVLMPIIAPLIVNVTRLCLLVFRNPVILLFETRMHLLELVLIVALLGNGIGFLIAGTEEATVAITVLLCAFWSLLVLGGSAWGLWVAAELNTECRCERCALILGGVLIPGAVLGVIVGPMALLDGMSLPVTVESLQSVCFGLGTVLGSLCLFWIIRGYHARASGAYHLKEVRQAMAAAKNRPFPRIRRTTHRLVMEQQHG